MAIMDLKSVGKFNPLPFARSRKIRGMPAMEREEQADALLRTRRNILRKLAARMRKERRPGSW